MPIILIKIVVVIAISYGTLKAKNNPIIPPSNIPIPPGIIDMAARNCDAGRITKTSANDNLADKLKIKK